MGESARAWESAGRLRPGELAQSSALALAYSDDELAALIDGVATRWNRLPEGGKAVVANLQALTEGHIIASVAFAAGECSVLEFGNAVLAASPLHRLFGVSMDDT